MSVNKYDATTGTLTTLASGSRIWTGTKAAYDAQKAVGTLPNNAIIVITDDETAMDTVPTKDSPVAVTSDGIYNALINKLECYTLDTVVGTNKTPIKINGRNRGKVIFVMISQQWNDGNATGARIGMIRCGYDGNNINYTNIADDNYSSGYSITFSASDDGYLVVSQASAGVSTIKFISNKPLLE